MPNKVTTSKQLSFIFSRLILFSEPAEGLKIWGLSIYVVSIICSPGWNRANSSAKIWWGEANASPLPPPLDSDGPVVQYRGALGEEEGI